ncbi:hypothetical protein WLH_05878 (plasmid) [Escherichia coli O25b:H4]|uniref:Uncharacterized protein n=1 Tax=Escherichia coli O25b:H4 TaxID=941280 RepID=A0A192CNT0_ECO25|nr:hypothetical protein WLH_05878 [Escherichia coli O25b:H4]
MRKRRQRVREALPELVAAGLDGNRVRGGQVRHHPAQGGRLPPPHSIVNKTFLSFIFNGLFSC